MVHYIFHGLAVIIILYLLSKIGDIWLILKKAKLDKQKVINEFITSDVKIMTLQKQNALLLKINKAFQEQEFEIIDGLNEKLRKEIQFQSDFFKE